MRKLIPDGINDFKILIENNYYYVDKTPFISEVGRNVGKTFLFTRPRGFGKTLNMSMLKYFFDVREAEENRKLFQNLKISESPYFEEQGKYPVIFLSMKDIKGVTWEEISKKIKELIKNLYSEFIFLRETLDLVEQKYFDKIVLIESDENFESSLKYLATFLKKYYKQRVVILIDEYDTPLISAYKYGYHKEANRFFSNLYESVLKDNPILQIGIMTGRIRVVKSGIFAGFNNINEYNILDKKYSKYFGFLEEEIQEALKYYEVDSKLEEVHFWYNGYIFGDTKVYNSRSILKFLSKREPKNYWTNDTLDDYLIKDILKEVDKKTFEKLNKLLFGEKVEEEITGKLVLREILEKHDLWEFLLFLGYLTIAEKLEDDIYTIKIPNNEVKEFFKEEIF